MEIQSKLNQLIFAGIVVVIVLSTLLYGAVHPAVLGLTYAGIVLITICWAAHCIVSGQLRISREPIQLLLFAAAIYGLFQSIPYATAAGTAGVESIPVSISLDPFATRVNALHFLAVGSFFSVLCVSLDSASRLRKLVTFIVFFGGLYAFFAILQSVLSPGRIYGLLERSASFGSFASRNNFAAWMEMAVALPLGMLFTRSISQDKRPIYLTAAVLMGVSIVVSGSRGGLVVLLLMIVFLVFVTYSRSDRKSTALQVVLGSGLVLAIIGGTVFVGGENSLVRIAEVQGAEAGEVTRPQIWNVTLKMIAANMPWGVGLGAYPVAYTRFDEASGFDRVEQAHNDFLQVLSDAGLIGGLLGIAFLLLLFKLASVALRTANIERRGIATGAVTGILAVLVHSVFDFVLHTTAVGLLFLTLIGILTAARSSYGDDSPEQLPQRRRKRSLGTA